LIKLQEEINEIIEELLEEVEMDITDINNLIYATAKIITLKTIELSKIGKNRRNAKFWKNKNAETYKQLEKRITNNS
jgi:hypothetical protein